MTNRHIVTFTGTVPTHYYHVNTRRTPTRAEQIANAHRLGHSIKQLCRMFRATVDETEDAIYQHGDSGESLGTCTKNPF